MKQVIFIVPILFILPLLYNCSSSGPSELEASVIIQDFVKDKLKSPSTAEFEMGMVNKIKKVDESTYEVNSYVDSQNSFGGTIRTKFYCKVQHKSKDSWSLITLNFK